MTAQGGWRASPKFRGSEREDDIAARRARPAVAAVAAAPGAGTTVRAIPIAALLPLRWPPVVGRSVRRGRVGGGRSNGFAAAASDAAASGRQRGSRNCMKPPVDEQMSRWVGTNCRCTTPTSATHSTHQTAKRVQKVALNQRRASRLVGVWPNPLSLAEGGRRVCVKLRHIVLE